ncbi:universal stress protein [Guyparkeria hydrothermalis]|uniref:universal stress protein n=1 Tax=Guyparkeria hydrothermalis TaxID=923 RepID=UPI002021FB76|nr:universal stress protein [Guyparkeria hydrothermalis]MCL7744124.1 universal stress protein [Guyparkeria hydrothermalis]
MAESHVLVLLDTSPASEAALDSAARLARHHQLELIALFIEDQDLIASAGHVFTREISLLSGEARPFDREILLSRLARQRQQIETRLASLGGQERLRWRLDVVTGPVTENILEAALNAEWVVLGKAGWSASRGGRLGSTARHLVESTGSRLLLWEERAFAPQAAIAALVHDPASGDAVVETTRQLALATERSARLLLLPDVDPNSLPALASWQQQGRPAVTVERLTGRGAEALRRSLQAQPAAALVIDDAGAFALDLPMADLIARIDIPIIRLPSPAAA